MGEAGWPLVDSAESIRSRLARLAKDPQLAPLAARLMGPDGIDHDFFCIYFQSNVHYARRSQLLRLALDDTRAGSRNTVLPPLTSALLRKIVMFLESHPHAPLEPFKAQFTQADVPSHLARLLGGRKMRGTEFVRRVVVQPYFRAVRGELPFPGIPGDVTARDAQVILPSVVHRVLLTPADADRFLTGGYTQPISDFFFNTGVSALDVRNTLVFAAEFFARTGHRGRLQSQIPVVLSKRIGIHRLCLPDFMLAVDLFALALLGILRPSQEPAATPLKSVIDEMVRAAGSPRLEPLDLRALAKHHLQRSLLDPAGSASLRGTQLQSARGRQENVFLSGLLFNLERLVYGRAASGRFAGFGPLYRRIDDSVLKRFVLDYFLTVDRAFGEALSELMESASWEFTGLSCRSLSNTLFHARWLVARGEQPGVGLPSVAKYKLGMPEPVPRKTHKKDASRRPRRSHPERHAVRLPVLEELSARVSILDI